jgi:mannose-6-phosphate isomerase-like protein (cupin superfamily)
MPSIYGHHFLGKFTFDSWVNTTNNGTDFEFTAALYVSGAGYSAHRTNTMCSQLWTVIIL